MTAASIATRTVKIEIGAVWSDALAMIAREWGACVVLAAALSLAPRLVLSSFFLRPALDLAHALGMPAGTWLGGFVVGWVAGTLLVAPFACLLAVLLTWRFAADPTEQRLSWSDTLTAGLKRTPPLYLASVIVDFLSTLGFALLIVPGVLLTLAWSVVSPVIVLEGAGPVKSLRRSADLTRGCRRAIFGFWLTYFVVAVLIGLILGFAAGILGAVFHLRSILLSSASTMAEVVATVFGIAGRTALFRELETLKEGRAPSAAAAVFD